MDISSFINWILLWIIGTCVFLWEVTMPSNLGGFVFSSCTVVSATCILTCLRRAVRVSTCFMALYWASLVLSLILVALVTSPCFDFTLNELASSTCSTSECTSPEATLTCRSKSLNSAWRPSTYWSAFAFSSRPFRFLLFFLSALFHVLICALVMFLSISGGGSYFGLVLPLREPTPDFLLKSFGGRSSMARLALMASWRSSTIRFFLARQAATRTRRYSRKNSGSEKLGFGLASPVLLMVKASSFFVNWFDDPALIWCLAVLWIWCC